MTSKHRPYLVNLIGQLVSYFEMDKGGWPSCSVVDEDGHHGGLVEDRLYLLLQELQEFERAYEEEQITDIEEWTYEKLASKRHNIWGDSED